MVRGFVDGCGCIEIDGEGIWGEGIKGIVWITFKVSLSTGCMMVSLNQSRVSLPASLKVWRNVPSPSKKPALTWWL